MATDAREREREALAEAHDAVCRLVVSKWPNEPELHRFQGCDRLHHAIDAYGRAVREADKEAARGQEQGTWSDWEAGYYKGRSDAAAAIEALKEKP